ANRFPFIRIAAAKSDIGVLRLDTQRATNWRASQEPFNLSINIEVDDSQSEFFQNLIVEYSSGSALEGLEPHLPYTCTAQGDSTVVYEVKTLSSAYATKVGSNVTKTYLAELKQLAKMSGKDYGDVSDRGIC
ncbi:paraneoplastic antigen Ma1-like, partial [Scomber scombrus]